MELARAYAVLGVEGDSSLESARQAFATWHHLYSGARYSGIEDASGWGDSAAAQALHELDVAFQTIERAHARTARRWRRSPTCEECNRGPALQVSFTRTMPGLHGRTQTTTATLCRECGLKLFADVQGKNRRAGWWGLAAPFRNIGAMTGNRVEARFIRALGDPQGDRPAAPDRFVAAAEAAADCKARKIRSRTRRAMPWVTGVAAIAIAVGIAVPAAGGSGGSDSPGTSTSASVTGN